MIIDDPYLTHGTSPTLLAFFIFEIGISNRGWSLFDENLPNIRCLKICTFNSTSDEDDDYLPYILYGRQALERYKCCKPTTTQRCSFDDAFFSHTPTLTPLSSHIDA